MTKRVTPDEAARLQAEGWTYVDVRSVPEFEEGHPAGAFNVPLLHQGPGGLVPNPDFERVMQSAFARDTRLLLGCRSGNRSLRAATELQASGFVHLIDVRGGYAGEIDALGDVACPGWRACSLPSSTTPEPGRSWAELSRR